MTSRIWRFGIVGVVNTAVGLAVIYGALFAGLGDFASNALGYGCGLALSFVLHRGWTFAGRTRSLPRDSVGFVLAWGAAYAANLAAVATGRTLGFIDNPFVQLAGVLVFAATFYLITSRLVFVGPADRG
uniref:GtrA family protein n=1 Tax=Altererythrobacter segetis TaxID=1104773 RepID=UPI00140E2010|nr:GtrA family protein [Altererythrobacter segetis]